MRMLPDICITNRLGRQAMKQRTDQGGTHTFGRDRFDARGQQDDIPLNSHSVTFEGTTQQARLDYMPKAGRNQILRSCV